MTSLSQPKVGRMELGIRSIIIAFIVLAASVQAASANERIADRSEFLSAIEGKTLKIRLYTLSLNIGDDGSITGSALGGKITGNWAWDNGYFCREMTWGSREIDYNCQEVKADTKSITFTTDRGAGDSATFRMVAR